MDHGNKFANNSVVLGIYGLGRLSAMGVCSFCKGGGGMDCAPTTNLCMQLCPTNTHSVPFGFPNAYYKYRTKTHTAQATHVHRMAASRSTMLCSTTLMHSSNSVRNPLHASVKSLVTLGPGDNLSNMHKEGRMGANQHGK